MIEDLCESEGKKRHTERERERVRGATCNELTRQVKVKKNDESTIQQMKEQQQRQPKKTHTMYIYER